MHHSGEQFRGVRARVLVVDDDRAVSVALERSLRHLGYDVLVAADGLEGFEQALRAEPAVVLADVHMPGMDGHALLRRLMQSGLQASVILMSGQGELDDAIGAFREGAVDYLKKPWGLQDLAAVLDRAMGLAGALRELSAPTHTSDALAEAHASEEDHPLDAAAFIEHRLHDAAGAEGLAFPAPAVTVARLRGGAPVSTSAIDDMARLLAKAPLLSAAVLRTVGEMDGVRLPILANQLLAEHPFESVHESIEALALRELFPIRVAGLRTLNERIWRFSLSRALAMRGIADLADPQIPRDRHQYFMFGLLLDVGASYLLSEISAEMERSDSSLADSGAMTAAVAAHHGEMGAWVFERWGFSRDWVSLVREHHREPPLASGHLCCATVLGSALAGRLAGFGDPSGERELRSESLARCAYTLGLGDTGLRALTKSLTDDVTRVWDAST